MKHKALTVLLYLLCFSTTFGQRKWLAEWGTDLVTPKYSTYSFKQDYIYLKDFGSFFPEKPQLKKFTFLTDLNVFLRIRKDRKLIKASLGMFNERFNINDEFTYINFKSYNLSGERNGLRTGLLVGYRIFDRTGIHFYLSLGGSYDVLVYRTDYNPVNLILNSTVKQSADNISIYQTYFLDRDFTIPRVGLTGSLDVNLSNYTFSLIYEHRNPALNPVASGPVLFNNTSVIKLQLLSVFGYKMK